MSPGEERREGGRAEEGRAQAGQPRPQLGFLPWFALFRRMRALRFLVFFDIGPTGYRVTTASLSAAAQEASARAGRSAGSR